jgi:hypothetical protein
MHELRRLPDDVLKRTEVCAWYLHQVHDKYGAIDLETHAKNSTLLVDVRAELERRGITDEPDDSDDDNGNPDNGVYTDTHDHPKGM